MRYKFANHRDHPCTFAKNGELNVLQSAKHKDHVCTFGKLRIKSEIMVNNEDHPCTLLFSKKK
ncbi:hypothetical protein Hanom_Chr11g01059521 [Helianthus anomalus]